MIKKFAHKFEVAAALLMSSGLALADDPTTTLVTQLGTYATDVGLLAVAVLGIYYGKKLVPMLKV